MGLLACYLLLPFNLQRLLVFALLPLPVRYCLLQFLSAPTLLLMLLDQSVPLHVSLDAPSVPGPTIDVPDAKQSLPPIKLHRSGPADQWVVADQQSVPYAPYAPGSCSYDSYPRSYYPGHLSQCGSWFPCGGGQFGHARMMPHVVCAPSYSCS